MTWVIPTPLVHTRKHVPVLMIVPAPTTMPATFTDHISHMPQHPSRRADPYLGRYTSFGICRVRRVKSGSIHKTSNQFSQARLEICLRVDITPRWQAYFTFISLAPPCVFVVVTAALIVVWTPLGPVSRAVSCSRTLRDENQSCTVARFTTASARVSNVFRNMNPVVLSQMITLPCSRFA